MKIGQKSEEGKFVNYLGVGAFTVLAINPTKAELEKIYGRDMMNEPEYLSKTETGENMVRLAIYLKTDTTAKVNNGIDLIVPLNITLTQASYVGSTSGKTQIIDIYGRTAWATPEELANKLIPTYTNGPANISANYRKSYRGEEAFVKFIADWLNIANPMTYNRETGKWSDKPDMSDSEIKLDYDKLFKGDVSELKGLVNLAKEHAFKAVVGVRTVTNEKGTRLYQQVYNKAFAKNAVTDYSNLNKDIIETQNNGGMAETEFSILPLHEHTVEATSFNPLTESAAAEDKPW